MMISVFALVGLVIANRASQIAPEEAVSTALWFTECVDIDKPMRLAFVRLANSPNKRYVVKFKVSGDRYPVFIEIDALSGDVIEASHGPNNLDRNVLSEQTDRWIKRLGRDQNTIRNEFAKSYQGTHHGLIFENRTGYRQIDFVAPNGRFKHFRSFGDLPVLPDHLRNFTSQLIVEIVTKACKDNPVFEGEPVEGNASKAVLYRPDQNKAQWVWKVQLGNGKNESWAPKMEFLVNDEDGNILNEEVNQPIPYIPRAPRIGLRQPTKARVDLTSLSKAKMVLADLGREEVIYTDIILDNGITLREGEWPDRGIDLKLDYNGRLLFFKARTTPGVMEPGAAIERGSKLIRSLTQRLPEGEFVIHPSVSGPLTSVVFRQTAFGYPYLESEVAGVDMNTQGQVARFWKRKPLNRPRSVPKQLLTAKVMEDRALNVCPPQLLPNTPDVTYCAISSVEQLGWYSNASEKEVLLAYKVMVGAKMAFKVGGSRGWGTIYYFDAATGRKLESIKSPTDFEDQPDPR